MPEPEKCSSRDCQKDARCAVRTTRPSRADLRVMLYADNRVAPKTAQRYCHEHGVQLMHDVTNTVVDIDDEETGECNAR